MISTKLTLDDVLRKLPKIELRRGEEITSGWAHRQLTIDQLESVVGGTQNTHTCGTASGPSGAEDACDPDHGE